MSAVRHFISESIRKAEVDEYLGERFKDAGYGGVEIAKTPLGVRITVQAMKPGLVIGRGGETIRGLGVELQQKFNLANPQISVSEVQVPELNPYIVASQIASAIQRGIHFRRAGFRALESIMNAGALGAEITMRGKLTTERSRYEKFRLGYIPKVGDPAIKNLKEAVLNVQLKPGLWGIKVRITPSTATFPDRITVKEIPPPSKAEAEVSPAPEAQGVEAAGDEPVGSEEVKEDEEAREKGGEET